MLFWVAATLEPTKKEREEESKQETLLVQPKIVVAKDDKTAAMKMLMDSTELKGADLNRVNIHVSPF